MLNQQSYIERCVNELAEITEQDSPYTRLVFSQEFDKAREWLRFEFEKLDLTVRTDNAGNLIGSYKSGELTDKKVMIGSHLDTVKSGGRFDGVAGIVASLAILKEFRENNVLLPFDIELYDYLGEELNDWNISCLGTRAMTGLLDDEILRRTDGAGRVLKNEIDRVGGNSDKLAEMFECFANVIACFELHIEQGRVLERTEKDIGIVKSIPSISRHSIQINGRAGHSGTTLMNERKDALVGASQLITFINNEATKISGEANRHFVATIGKIDNYPNAATIIPSKVEMLLDLRVVEANQREEFLNRLRVEVEAVSLSKEISVKFCDVAYSPFVELNQDLNSLIEKSIRAEGHSYVYMDSGAGHDTAHLARVAPASMIFIACKDGLSHCPEEFALIEDIQKGAEVISRSILGLTV
jgi:N-carbamoyl-L-amino-acid hydrolase